jgi:hypothetical protein
MALTPIQQVRLLVQDCEPGLYFLADDEIEFLLERNADSINATSIEAARLILFKLAQRSDETVDTFSIKGSKAAEQYRLALQLYLKDSNLNPILNNVGGYVGGISKSDMESNDANTDNNTANSGTTKFNATFGYSLPFQL